MEGYEDTATGITYEDIGGLDNEIQLVREMVELPLKHPELFIRLGIDPPISGREDGCEFPLVVSRSPDVILYRRWRVFLLLAIWLLDE